MRIITQTGSDQVKTDVPYDVLIIQVKETMEDVMVLGFLVTADQAFTLGIYPNVAIAEAEVKAMQKAFKDGNKYYEFR